MNYTIDRTIPDATLDEVDACTRKALADHGFGVLTEIDVRKTMKAKLDVDMPAYRILGACNPKMAYQTIGIERVGAMLPCNVILREVDGGVEVSAIDPVASMQAIEHADLTAVADDTSNPGGSSVVTPNAAKLLAGSQCILPQRRIIDTDADLSYITRAWPAAANATAFRDDDERETAGPQLESKWRAGGGIRVNDDHDVALDQRSRLLSQQ